VAVFRPAGSFLVSGVLAACSVYDASLIGQKDAGGAGAPASGGSDASVEPTAGSGGAAGGGAGGIHSSGGAAGDVGITIIGSDAAKALDLELIDDLEDGDHRIKVHMRRGGYWFTAGDSAPRVTYTPNPFAPTALDLAERHVPESNYSAVLRVEQIGGWGALFGFMYSGTSGTYDATAYCGIRFVGRLKPEGAIGKLEMRTKVATDAGAKELNHQYSFELVPEWRDYRILWSELESTADPPVAFDPTVLLQTNLSASKVGSWEFGIDDIEFLLKPEGGVCP
jgi:hypothetical protein